MGASAYLEPLAVIVLLFGGAWINRATDYTFSIKRSRWREDPFKTTAAVAEEEEVGTQAQALFAKSRSLYPSFLTAQTSAWRMCEARVLSWRKEVITPNTAVFQNRLLSRLLHMFPFLVEAWYWALIYWNRLVQHRDGYLSGRAEGPPAGPALYEARRRTMAVCNLLAFVVFTLWPCMPPRLLSDPLYDGPAAEEARSYGFVDSVLGKEGASSVWTQNKFCNQHAAMPSLHFGYSLMIGLTIMSIPLTPEQRSRPVHLPFFNNSHPALAPIIALPSTQRMICILLGFLYPSSILVAIVATANHFILDAVAGAIICCIGWNMNAILLNLLPLEDYLLWCLRTHKPIILGFEADATHGSQDEKVRARTAVVGNWAEFMLEGF